MKQSYSGTPSAVDYAKLNELMSEAYPNEWAKEEAIMEKFLRETKQTVTPDDLTNDYQAIKGLAESQCPADIIEFGRRHKIENFAQLTWMDGFTKGWREAIKMMNQYIRETAE